VLCEVWGDGGGGGGGGKYFQLSPERYVSGDTCFSGKREKWKEQYCSGEAPASPGQKKEKNKEGYSCGETRSPVSAGARCGVAWAGDIESFESRFGWGGIFGQVARGGWRV